MLHSTRVDLAVSNEAIVKLFTSCLVKRDHSVVEMKVFEIFTCLHGLGMENKLKTYKKTPTNLQPKSLLDYVSGQWLAGGVSEMALRLAPLSTRPWVGFLLPQITDWMMH